MNTTLLFVLLFVLLVAVGLFCWFAFGKNKGQLGGYVGGFIDEYLSGVSGGGCGCSGGEDYEGGDEDYYDGGEERIIGVGAGKGDSFTANGSGKISDKEVGNLVLNGDFSLVNVKAKSIVINGFCRGVNVQVSGQLDVTGGCFLRDSSVKKLVVHNLKVTDSKPPIVLVGTTVSATEIKDSSAKESDFIRHAEPRPPRPEGAPHKGKKPAA